jgi:hypothetical protein
LWLRAAHLEEAEELEAVVVLVDSAQEHLNP